jgi:Zn-dependent peptidase ImmA (M78 family)
MDYLSSEKEKEADELAAEILMPPDLIESFLKEKEITKDTRINRETVVKLAERFNVETAIAIIRLRELGYYVPYDGVKF